MEARTYQFQPPTSIFCPRCTVGNDGGTLPRSEKLSPQLSISANDHHDTHGSACDMDLYWMSNSRRPEFLMDVGPYIFVIVSTMLSFATGGIRTLNGDGQPCWFRANKWTDTRDRSTIIKFPTSGCLSTRFKMYLVGLCALDVSISRFVPAHRATAISWGHKRRTPTPTESMTGA